MPERPVGAARASNACPKIRSVAVTTGTYVEVIEQVQRAAAPGMNELFRKPGNARQTG